MVTPLFDLDDMTQPLEAVVRKERAMPAGERLAAQFEEFYDANPELLGAHVDAARIIERAGLPVSARFLTDLARWMGSYWQVMPELIRIYGFVFVNAGPDYKVNNNTAAGLTRYLGSLGFKVTRRFSKMDGRDD